MFTPIPIIAFLGFNFRARIQNTGGREPNKDFQSRRSWAPNLIRVIHHRIT